MARRHAAARTEVAARSSALSASFVLGRFRKPHLAGRWKRTQGPLPPARHSHDPLAGACIGHPRRPDRPPMPPPYQADIHSLTDTNGPCTARRSRHREGIKDGSRRGPISPTQGGKPSPSGMAPASTLRDPFSALLPFYNFSEILANPRASRQGTSSSILCCREGTH